VHKEKTPNLVVSEVNLPGFGDLDNKYSLGMATFGEYVYVGTLNAPGFPVDLVPWFLGNPLDSTGAKVYRGKPDPTGKWHWEEVFDFGKPPAHQPENFGIREMLVVGDYLYFVTANHEGTPGNGVEVWQTEDGIHWSQKSPPGFGNPNNISGRSIAECGGYLYVGVENRDTGAQLWRHPLDAHGDLDPNGSWKHVPAANDGFGNPNNFFISDLVLDPLRNNTLYASTINGFEGMELWRISHCDVHDSSDVAASVVFDGGWPTGPLPCPLPTIELPSIGRKLSKGKGGNGSKAAKEGGDSTSIDLCVTNSGILTLTTVGKAVFVGTLNYIFGASLFVTFDGEHFLPVFLFGNGDDRNSYVWAMEEYDGRLYIGTFGRPNLRNIIDIPDDIDIDLDLPSSLSDINAQDIGGLLQLLQGLGSAIDLSALPGITAELGDIDLDAIADSGEFSLFSLDPNEYTGDPLHPYEVVTETTNSFGSCFPYGIRTMAVLENKLVIGSAGASSDGGTLVYEGISRKTDEYH
jgi:hypothetical protein